MTIDEINKLKYEICCPLCDEPICVKGSSKCEAEIWKKRKLKEKSNENNYD